MTRRALAAIVLTLAASAAAFGQANAEEARRELDAGARAYRDGRFEEAERRFRRALELDPEAKNASVFIARAVQQQYKPGVQTPENFAAGERAVAAHQEVLAKDPGNEDAYKAVVFLYGQMKRDDKVVEMLTQRANDFSASNRQRAEAFTILASRQWQCSYDVTEQKENKTAGQGENKPAEQKKDKPAEQKPEKVVIKYRMPADAGDFIRARQCVTDGMQFVEQAVTLDPANPNAWSYKANLLREAAKLAEMEGDAAQKDDLERQYGEALGTQKRAAQEALKRKEAEEQGRAAAAETSAPPRPAAPPGRAPFTASVLDGKATFKPTPTYPPEARAAGAEGTVVVRVAVDESGKVVEAEAISGPALLREAAVAAARRALFQPKPGSGRPVKVSGVLTYKFALKPEAARQPR